METANPASHNIMLPASLTGNLQHILKAVPLSVRKDIMTICRVGVNYKVHPRLTKLVSRWKHSVFVRQHGASTECINGQQLLDVCMQYISSPVRRGFLSLLLRCVPTTKEDADKTLSNSITKELRAGQCQVRREDICYPFLSDYRSSATIQLNTNIPARPFIQMAIHNRLLNWRKRLDHLYFLPSMSNKTVGTITRNNYYDYCGLEFEHRKPGTVLPMVTTALLEEAYCVDGVRIPGPVEVRSAWKYSQLQPRVYYAQGGDSYFGSRYIKPLLDSLQKVFSSTHPHQRFSFSRFPEIEFTHEVFMIYDYSAFTSSLAELPVFIEELANFLEGYAYTYFDTNKGELKGSLSHLLRGYNAICNQKGLYDATRIAGKVDTNGLSEVLVPHEVSGMLGVYGNITGSTVLHGLVGIVIAGGENRLNAIGDDAGGIYDLDYLSVDETQDAITSIGGIPKEKFQVWTKNVEDREDASIEGPWHYVKRPVDITIGSVIQGWMPDFQIYPEILDCVDPFHTSLDKTFIDRRRLLISQTCRLFDVLYKHHSDLSEADVALVLDYTRFLFIHLKIDTRGTYPSQYRNLSKYRHHTGDTLLATPRICIESITNGWLSTLRIHGTRPETGTIRLPVHRYGLDRFHKKNVVIGNEFVCAGSQWTSLLEKIGVLSSRTEYEDVYASDQIIEEYEQLVSGVMKAGKTYTVVREYDLLDSCSCFYDDDDM